MSSGTTITISDFNVDAATVVGKILQALETVEYRVTVATPPKSRQARPDTHAQRTEMAPEQGQMLMPTAMPAGIGAKFTGIILGILDGLGKAEVKDLNSVLRGYGWEGPTHVFLDRMKKEKGLVETITEQKPHTYTLTAKGQRHWEQIQHSYTLASKEVLQAYVQDGRIHPVPHSNKVRQFEPQQRR